MTLRRIVATALAIAMASLVAAGPVAAAGKPAPQAKVDLNTASIEQLTTLPGVGKALAARIVEYREKAGRFSRTEELMNVKGVGEKSFHKIEAWLTVSEPRRASK